MTVNIYKKGRSSGRFHYSLTVNNQEYSSEPFIYSSKRGRSVKKGIYRKDCFIDVINLINNNFCLKLSTDIKDYEFKIM